MAEQLTILHIKDPKKASQITRVLTAHFHDLNANDILYKLRNLPWNLPEIKDFNRVEDLKGNLERLGCAVAMVYREKKEDKVLPQHVEKEMPKGPKIIHSTIAERPDVPLAPPPKRPVSVPEPPKTIKPWKKNLGIVAGIIAAVLLLWWLSTLKKTGSEAIKEYQSETTSGKQTSSSVSGANPGNFKHRSKKSEAMAQHHYQKALASKFAPEREGFLRNALQNNPYHTGAWHELIKNLEDQYKFKEAKNVRKQAYEYNEKVRMVLQSLALKFGRVDIPLHLNNVEFNFNIKIPASKVKNVMDHGYFFYREVQEKHRDKAISATFRSGNGQAFQMSVPASKKPLSKSKFKKHFREVQ